jgi:hypothetical protein
LASNTDFVVLNGINVGTSAVIAANGAWIGSGTNITGNAGVQGPAGRQGAQGAAGRQGVQGAQGNAGAQGAQGAAGAQGLAGTPGAQGAAGAQGRQGVQGPQGAQGAAGAQGRQGFQGIGGVTGNQGRQGVQGAVSALDATISALGVNTPPGPAGTLRATDDISASFSDVRLKDNIEYIKDAAEKLYQLNGVFYKQNSLAEKFGYHDYSRQVGLIAQEVQKILPEVVTLAPFDIDEYDQSRTGENYLTIYYERIIPLIVETIKTQQKEIEKLKEILNGK